MFPPMQTIRDIMTTSPLARSHKSKGIQLDGETESCATDLEVGWLLCNAIHGVLRVETVYYYYFLFLNRFNYQGHVSRERAIDHSLPCPPVCP